MERKSTIHHLSSVGECINNKMCWELSPSQFFHRGTSFIRTLRGSIQETYTPCTVDKIISSLWIWLGSSGTWAIATLIWDDKSLGEKKGSAKKKDRKGGLSIVPSYLFIFNLTMLGELDNEKQYFRTKQSQTKSIRNEANRQLIWMLKDPKKRIFL